MLTVNVENLAYTWLETAVCRIPRIILAKKLSYFRILTVSLTLSMPRALQHDNVF